MSGRRFASDLYSALGAIADEQFGLVRRDEIEALGLSSSGLARLVRSGLLERIRPGVYRLLGALPSRETEIMAALLWAHDAALASHRTGAEINGIAGSFEEVEITTTRSVRAPDLIVHRRAVWLPGDATIVDGIPVTSVERTIVDLASVASRRSVERSLDSALLLPGVTLETISRRLEATARQGRNGTTKLRGLIAERETERSPVESPLERDFLTLVRERQMPEPVAQYPVIVDGRIVARLDFAYPELKLGIELDGYAFHSSREAFERDRRRLTMLGNEGWRILVFTRNQVNDHPVYVEKSVLRAYAATWGENSLRRERA
ncbi:MAG: type IV toxin-antitoxin system AbiEi family antitoxin domain-containing protein [Actinomycetota bacterium]